MKRLWNIPFLACSPVVGPRNFYQGEQTGSNPVAPTFISIIRGKSFQTCLLMGATWFTLLFIRLIYE